MRVEQRKLCDCRKKKKSIITELIHSMNAFNEITADLRGGGGEEDRS